MCYILINTSLLWLKINSNYQQCPNQRFLTILQFGGQWDNFCFWGFCKQEQNFTISKQLRPLCYIPDLTQYLLLIIKVRLNPCANSRDFSLHFNKIYALCTFSLKKEDCFLSNSKKLTVRRHDWRYSRPPNLRYLQTTHKHRA